MMHDQLINTLWPLFGVLLVCFVAMATMAGIGRWIPEPAGNRFKSLDGLRGFLALFVLSHHSLYWYERISTGNWSMSSILYENLGKCSVSMFFMLSSFLFFGKILDSKDRPIDWERFAIGRFFRIGMRV